MRVMGNIFELVSVNGLFSEGSDNSTYMSATCQPANQVDKWYDAGQFAMIYFFEYGHEISNHEKGRVESLFVANNLVYDREELGEWCFSFLRKLNGATRMVDCGKCPESELCRT